MKKDKKYNLIDEIGNIDSSLIEKIANIDTLEKLELAKNKKSINISKFFKLSIGAVLTCSLFIGLILIKDNNNEPIKIPEPIIEVNELSEMKKYLGFIPSILQKQVNIYQIINDDEAPISEIIYVDNSRFRMSLKNGDISGIYGGTLENEMIIKTFNIKIYKFEDTRYAVWMDSQYSYSYLTNKNNENFLQELESLIK